MATPLQTGSCFSRGTDLQNPQEQFRRPCDVTVVVKDGKEFDTHGHVLSEASPFFEKLLGSEMRERKERKIRLEMLTEQIWGKILSFIYSGTVQIYNEQDARDLISMADYFLIKQLKNIAGEFLAQNLETSNCISTYHFAEKYRCEELLVDTKRFILRNFSTIATTEDFSNMSSKEVEMWISSDETNIQAEEDVFKVILRWITRNRKERKQYFYELFRHVRLAYVSVTYLRKVIATSNLVRDNRKCLRLVKDAIKKSKKSHRPSEWPRKSLETPLMTVCVDKRILSYFPRQDKWSRLGESKPPCSIIFSSRGQLYFVNQVYHKLLRYDSFSHRWTTLPYNEKKSMRQVYISSKDEIFALMIDDRISCLGCISLRSSRALESTEHEEIQHPPRCGKSHLSSVMRYRPETNLWQETSSFDLGSRDGICFVASEKFVYLIGGYIRGANKILTDVDRFDFARNSWSKAADMLEPRHCPYGAALHGKVYITDNGSYDLENFTFKRTCEVYSEATDEWHFVANMTIPRSRHGSMLCVDEKICVLDDYFKSMSYLGIKIHCYDPDKDEWQEQTDHKIPVKRGYSVGPTTHYSLHTCATSIFQPGQRLASESSTTTFDKCKCLIM